ncbi:MAG: tRNA (adenosine(37)-N6)-threonylcarbamoyltransferase complex dimerization subunit type 1 TsaB [Planctomycetaceae bacterium]
MLILAVETSTFTGSVALVEGATEGGDSPSLRVIGETTLQVSETHSSRLMPSIDRLLRETSLPVQKVQGIAVGLGPGSFTGLRIAVSTVKGLAFALRVPVAGVPTLDALANNILYASTQVCPVLDARKKEVYAALFRGDGEGQLKKISDDWVLSPEDLCSRISEATVLVGNGTEVYAEIFRRRLGSRALFAPPELSFPRAVQVARLALPAFQRGEKLDLFRFTPIYVRRSEAEIHRERRERGEISSPGS